MSDIQIRIVVELDCSTTWRGQNKWRWKIQQLIDDGDWEIPWWDDIYVRYSGKARTREKALSKAFNAARHRYNAIMHKRSFEERRDESRELHIFVAHPDGTFDMVTND